MKCSRRAFGAHYWNRKFTRKSSGYDELDSTGVSLRDVELVYLKLRMIAETSQSWQKSRLKFIERNRLSKRWQSEAFREPLARRLLRCGSKLMHAQAQLILCLVRDGETWDSARLVGRGSDMRLELEPLGSAELATVAASLLLRPLVSAAAQGHHSGPSSTQRMIPRKAFRIRYLSRLPANRVML